MNLTYRYREIKLSIQVVSDFDVFLIESFQIVRLSQFFKMKHHFRSIHIVFNIFSEVFLVQQTTV